MKPYITKADKIFNGDILVFWKNGTWNVKTAEILISDSRDDHYVSIAITDKQSCRLKAPVKGSYIKIIFTSDKGEYHITAPEIIDRNSESDVEKE